MICGDQCWQPIENCRGTQAKRIRTSASFSQLLDKDNIVSGFDLSAVYDQEKRLYLELNNFCSWEITCSIT